MDDQKTSDQRLDALHTKAQELYLVKDNFLLSPTERSSQINEGVKQITEELNSIDVEHLTVKKKAFASYLLGKTLNVVSQHNKDAERSLSKAIKLDPSLIDAWNCLGECYWKKDDLEGAKTCFLGALEQAKNKDKVSLRNLSMVLRLINGDAGTRKANIELSVIKAKEAVTLDVKDGTSWYILGNAYLSNFFNNSNSNQDMTQALKAYQQAEANPITANNPDLYFNRAKLYQYQEDYFNAVEGFAKAETLDPAWKEPSQEIAKIIAFVDKITEYTSKKGLIKRKKLNEIVKTIPTTSIRAPNHTPALLSELVNGNNKGKLLIGKVTEITSKDFLPMTVLIVDKAGNRSPVSIYNIAQRGIKVNDTLYIPDPVAKITSFQYQEKKYTYACIQVDYRNSIVNDRLPDSNSFAPTELSIDKGLTTDNKVD